MKFRNVFWELFWATFKAMLVVAVFLAIQLGFVFNSSGSAKGVFDAFGGAFFAMIFGLVLSLPLILILVLFIGTPLSLLIIKKGWSNLYVFIFCGAFTSFVCFNGMKFLKAEEMVTLQELLKGNITFVLAGGLTGFFFYKQVQHKDKLLHPSDKP